MSDDLLSLDRLTSKLTNMRNSQPVNFSALLSDVRNSIWSFGIFLLLLGLGDRGFSAIADNSLTRIEISYLLLLVLIFISWICLKPETRTGGQPGQQDESDLGELEAEITAISQIRMQELKEYHLVSQEYFLPFPYLCQIYHLLNLKHLETVHNFSLNNLRVVKINQFEANQVGGMIKFQTVLDSPINALRIWRQPIVEVELTLHTPYTVELSIPVYGDKRITVLFNVIPITPTSHKFLVDIYSNLSWPKPVLQLLLHFAAGLTLFEDLPYLQQLAERNIYRVMQKSKASSHEMMLLFRHFIELYGSNLPPALPQASV